MDRNLKGQTTCDGASETSGYLSASPERRVLRSGLEVTSGAGRRTLPLLLLLRAPGGKVVDVVEESGSRRRSLEHPLGGGETKSYSRSKPVWTGLGGRHAYAGLRVEVGDGHGEEIRGREAQFCSEQRDQARF